MERPLQITFHNMEPLPAVEQAIRSRAERPERYCDRVTACRVIVDLPHKHHRTGNEPQIKLDITIPGQEIALQRESPGQDVPQALLAAVKEAFDAADRLLEGYVRRLRQDVKRHEELPHARVRALAAGQDFGFLETRDGREIYFHKNSLSNADFDSLSTGMEVTFVEEAGEKGPQATTVRVVGRHGGL